MWQMITQMAILYSWSIPLLFVTLIILVGLYVYFLSAFNLRPVVVVQGTLSIVYIVAIWLPFHNELHQTNGWLFCFATIAILAIISLFFMQSKSKDDRIE